MDLNQKVAIKQHTTEAFITRGDGTIEDLGVLTYWHRNPLKRLWWSLQQLTKKRRG